MSAAAGLGHQEVAVAAAAVDHREVAAARLTTKGWLLLLVLTTWGKAAAAGVRGCPSAPLS